MTSFNRLPYPACVLTIDFESWVHAYSPAGDSDRRRQMDHGYVWQAGLELLGLLDDYGIKATFFVVSEIFLWYPQLIEEIAAQGHEVAWHSHTHRSLGAAAELQAELAQAAEFLRHFKVMGFRAPRGGFRDAWLPLLGSAALGYDSSSYGPWEAVKEVHGILEVPVSAMAYKKYGRSRHHFGPLSLKLLRQVFPYGSGYFAGLLGPLVWRLVRAQQAVGRLTVLGIHLWQVVPPPWPRLAAHLLAHDWQAFPYCLPARGFFTQLLQSGRIMRLCDQFNQVTPMDPETTIAAPPPGEALLEVS